MSEATNAAAGNIKVVAGQSMTARAEAYPWLSSDATVPTVEVTLTDGTSFRYGSLIGLHATVTKIADSVPGPDSESLQNHLFMALPDILAGKPHSGVKKVENSNAKAHMLLIASRNIVRKPFLLFAIDSEEQLPTVLRAGVGAPKHYEALMNALRVVQVHGRKTKGR